MPTPERYYEEQIERAEESERQAARDTRRAWGRAIGEIWLWTALGLVGIALSFRTGDVARGWVYWWAGAFVWVAGVSAALFKAYRRAIRRGDMQ